VAQLFEHSNQVHFRDASWKRLPLNTKLSHSLPSILTYMNVWISSSTLHWTSCYPHPTAVYNKITSSSLSLCTTFSVSLTNLTVLLPQSHNCSCYISRQILAHPLLLTAGTLIYVHTTLRTLPSCAISPGSLPLPAPEAGQFAEYSHYTYNITHWEQAPLAVSEAHTMTATRHACGWELGKLDGVKWKVQIKKTDKIGRSCI